MSKTLNFVRILHRQGQHFHDIGLWHEAKSRFERLAAFRGLPADVVEDSRVRLSELCRDDDEPTRERHHLACALAQQPNNPDYHFRMAQAYLNDRDAPIEKALPHLRTAVRLDAENPRYLAALGVLTIRMGESTEALRLLKKPWELAEGDIDILERYADALRSAGEFEASRELLKTAMFRHSDDRRYRDLYRAFQFRDVADEQRSKAPIPLSDDEPVILRFALGQPKKGRVRAASQIVRLDGAGPLPRLARRSLAGA
jgi:tetratricopeptide (TPR) repeat protein